MITAQNNRVGINTDKPQGKLHVNGTFRYEHPSAGVNKVLTSDAEGNATWENIVERKDVVAKYTGGGEGDSTFRSGLSTGQSAPRATGATITLPPGDWLVFTSQYAFFKAGLFSLQNIKENDGIWVRVTLSDTPAGAKTTDLLTNQLISTFVTGEPGEGVLTGEFLVRNSTSANKTYYLTYTIEQQNFAGDFSPKNFGSSPDGVEGAGHWEENQLYAIPVN